ncbi:MAG: patatin-like phospholipase family protein [Thermotogaceae bacterium]|nr:patatin-like phospholipase family protein [Mesotoga sp.]NLX33049.1 patatin-like phospholipase family protein [Thermotogaceae bacterium]MDD5743534.1 patatin-like phospholipase family protein [Mesotoga sp.]HOI62621.1 patatin-like phospholipase family protein [Mesotoga sp.]HPX21587.1 patatin-like phospholipase family protein [Mesotoga sp.]
MPKVPIEENYLESDEFRFDGKAALILSGGGARGGYQIGCWKALKDHGIKIAGVYGTSVGSINAAAVAMDNFELATELWKNMDYSTVMEITPEVESVIQMAKAKAGIREVFMGIKLLMDGRGIDITPLRQCLHSRVDEEYVRKSGIDFGLVTYSLSDMRPVMLYINEIPRGMLVDYILASANYPVFKREEFNRRKFIDGGVYINIPIDMARKKGFTSMVVIDIGTKSLIDRLRVIAGTFDRDKTLYIRPKRHFGSPMQFEREITMKYLIEGYLDTLTALGVVQGSYTYIYETEDILAKLFWSIDEETFSRALGILNIERKKTESPMYFYFRQLLPLLEVGFKTYGSKRILCDLADYTFELMEIEELELYSGFDFFEAISAKPPVSFENVRGATINDIPLAGLLEMLSLVYRKSRFRVKRPARFDLYRSSLDFLGAK